jgi:P27 family predicted phage terminase small subunit
VPKGRRPLPSTIKNLRGNPGKRKQNQNEPEFQPGDPTMPAGLSEAAQTEWREIIGVLRAMGVLTPADGKALAAYCYAFDIWMQANESVKKYGVLIEEPIMGRVGTPEQNEIVGHKTKKNPAVAIANEALKTMKSFLVEFGMTPSSRSKLHVEKPKPKDDADEFFDRVDKKRLQPREIN